MGTPEETAPQELRSISHIVEWCRAAPSGTRLEAHALAELLGAVIDDPPDACPDDPTTTEPPDWTWRERLWVVPGETRLGVPELAEALGRPRSWIYSRTCRHAGTGPRRRERPADDLIPHRKLGGILVFIVGEVRAWIRQTEEEIAPYPMEFPPKAWPK